MRLNFLKAKKEPYILITCEHADYQIPKFIKSKIPKEYSLVNLKKMHASYDENALKFSQLMLKDFKKMGIKSDLISYPYTRLIIDANRTKGNLGFHSKICAHLSDLEIQKVEKKYFEYLYQAESLIEKKLKTHDVYIFSVHSFVPIYKTKKRKTEIGLLFRTKIKKENTFARSLKKEIQSLDPKLNVHKNLPYRGHTDCFLNYILDQHKNKTSVNGLFFELNQNFISSDISNKSRMITSALISSI